MDYQKALGVRLDNYERRNCHNTPVKGVLIAEIYFESAMKYKFIFIQLSTNCYEYIVSSVLVK